MEGAGSQLSPEEWGDQYAKSRRDLDLGTTKLRDLLAELTERAGVTTEAVEGRTKEVDSFIQKMRDKGQQYQDPLLEMPDLVGLRIVTYFVDDLSAVKTLLEENFEIDWSRSSIGTADGDPDRFGYVSDHYQVSIKPGRAELPEWEPFAGVSAEIQVRTVLQHAWAAISHKLQYKAALEVPRELRRQLSRMSALLEVADKEFSELSAVTATLDASYAAAIAEDNLDVELNRDSLAAFLNATQRHVVYGDTALALGYAPYEVPPETAARVDSSYLNTLFAFVLEGAELTDRWTVADFDKLVPEHVPKHIESGLKEILDGSIERGFLPTAVPMDMLILSYALAMRGGLDPDETAERTRYVDELKEALRAAMYNVE